MTYKQALEYLDSFIDYEKVPSYPYKASFDLARTEKLLGKMGSPQKQLRVLHVAGTKGKGSVCAYLFSILTAAGLKAGLYTSPHLISFRERIQVAENRKRRLITEDEISRLVEEIKPAIEAFSGEEGNGRPSFFEIYTGIAFTFFAWQQVDFAVVEVGLGGRLDATNVVKPVVSGITSISFEHTDKLGTTLEAIAGEKAGVIKRAVPVVSSPQEQEAGDVIRWVCAEKKTDLYEVGKDILFEESAAGLSGQRFSVRGIAGEHPDLSTPLLGRHQLENAAAAVGMIELLPSSGLTVSAKAIKEGTAKVRWPGRLDIIRENPRMVADGAQNRASAACLANAIKKHFSYGKIILVFGCSRDKDVEGMAAELFPLAEEVILTRADHPRALEPSIIKKRLSGFQVNLFLTEKVKDALDLAGEGAQPDDLILITGSLYLVGEAMKLLGRQPYAQDWY